MHGGRHELGQNFLRSHTTITTIASLARSTSGPIMEIGPGDGAVTAELYRLGRELTLVELDETRLDHLEDTYPRAEVRHADVLTTRLDRPVIVGNLPFHLTTPILRKLLRSGRWQQAILLTQWEVARKRAGVGGSTMMTAQWAPWFDFRLVTRVPADAFTPKPSVDGGILTIDRCPTGSIPAGARSDYQQFVRSVFTGRGRGMKGILTKMSITDHRTLQSTMDRNDIRGDTLPKDLTPDQWTGLFTELAAEPSPKNTGDRQKSAKTAKQQKTAKKGKTMRNDRGPKKNPITEAAPQTPLITGELPIVGAKPATEKLQAPIPGADPKAKSHDKGHLQAERGFMNQHQKPQQPQPRWNLPRR
nr:23S ribosomal RNA methyltransferase Erm [Brevibacterium limosum]